MTGPRHPQPSAPEAVTPATTQATTRAVSANHPSAQWRGRHLTVVPDETCWRCGKALPGVEPPAEPICDECYEIVVNDPIAPRPDTLASGIAAAGDRLAALRAPRDGAR